MMSQRPEVARTTTPRWQHVLAVGLSVALAFLVLGDALRRGAMVGPYDLLSQSGLTSQAGFPFHGNTFEPDPIKQMIPWTYLAWTQVHHGALPLWNPYSGLGVPLAFNWQSAAFSVPSLIGYTVPLREAYTAGVVTMLVIAGTGGYVFGRVLRLGLLGALTVMAVFELSGPLIAWSGYPQSQVAAWGGWIFAAALLILRGERRILSITLFAVSTAGAVYGGHPETLITTMSAALLFFVLLVVSRALPARLQFPSGPVLKPVVDLAAGVAVGAALSAPLLLPGAQLVTQSVRASGGSAPTLPLHDMLYLVFSNFDGTPVPGSYPFAGAFFYNETAMFVGIIAVVLALVGILVGAKSRRPAAIALTVVGVVLASVVWFGPLTTLANNLPLLELASWLRALMPLALVIAALAGIGMDGLLQKDAEPVARKALVGGFGLAALLVGALWVFGRTGSDVPAYFRALAEHEHTVSFLWPVIAIVMGLVVSGLLWWRPRWSAAGLSLLLGTEVLSLLAAGSVLIASSPDGYPATAAVQQLQRVVGDARVGTGGTAGVGCPLGVLPDANILFGIRQVNMNDPIMPKNYYSAWGSQNHSFSGSAAFSQFCPVITSAAQARQLGVSYVLEPAGAHGPTGTTYVTTLHVPNAHPGLPGTSSSNEDLYFVPASGVVTLSTRPAGGSSRRPAVHPKVSSTSSGTLDVTTRRAEGGTMNFHVSDVPGWHATIDGRPLPLRASSEFDLQADIPPGSHEIKLEYWPPLFSAGLILAAIAVVGIGCALFAAWLRTHRRRPGEPTR
jgi:Bacterial membrane protein YfhO